MSIRHKQPTPYAQGYADYKICGLCPFEEGSHDAQEWEVGWLDSRHNGNRGTQGVGGEHIRKIETNLTEHRHEQLSAPISRTL